MKQMAICVVATYSAGVLVGCDSRPTVSANSAGAGAEVRKALGTAVFFGMLGVTLFGLLFAPVFYVLVRWIGSVVKRGT